MKYTRENHWAIQTLNKTFTKKENQKRLDFIVTGNMKNIPVEIEYNKTLCWINSSELEMFKLNNININNVEVVMYTEGIIGPFNEKTSTLKAIDGYKVDVIYND